MTDMTISERNKVDIEVASAVQHDGYKAFQRIDELEDNIGSMSNAFSSMAGDYSQHKSKSESELTEHETKLSDLEKRLTALESAGSGADPLSIYPVGSIYLSVNATSPAELFGGTWEQIKDTFLLASGDTYEAGSTGGVLAISNMPPYLTVFVWKRTA